jgi:iron complex transport system substrate-binding protein
VSTASSPSSAAASSPTTTASTTAASTSLSTATQYPLTVTDDQGTSVTFAAKPTHIVSLVPSNTEILYAVGAGDDLVAGTQYDDYPPEAKSKALIKGLKPSLEVVTAYHPDLVLASSSNASDLVQQLRTLHIPVVYLDPHDLAGVYHDIQLVGQIVDAVPAAQKVVAGMQQKVDMVTAKTASVTAKPRVFIEIDASDPTKIFTVGPGSFIDTLVTMAGGANDAHDAKSAYPQLGLEALVAADPQIIILDDAAFGATPDAVAKRPGWASLTAVKDHKVYPIDDSLVSRPGPRLADGLLAMAKLIHPELFP